MIVNGGGPMEDGGVNTMDTGADRGRVEVAVDRFDSETDWEPGMGGVSCRATRTSFGSFASAWSALPADASG